MRAALLILSLIPLLLLSCQQGNRADAVINGVGELDVAEEFEELFPGSHHFISYYSGTKGDPTWNSKTGLHGRYVLHVKFRIDFDEWRTHPIRQGEPKFLILELDGIRPNGYSYTEHQLEFSLAEWMELVESGGDFDVIGYPMTKDQPLAGFEDVWRKF